MRGFSASVLPIDARFCIGRLLATNSLLVRCEEKRAYNMRKIDENKRSEATSLVADNLKEAGIDTTIFDVNVDSNDG